MKVMTSHVKLGMLPLIHALIAIKPGRDAYAKSLNSLKQTKWLPFRRRRFQTNFMNENAWISLKISLKFVPKVPINTIPALVQIMAWRRPGDKPLSDPLMDNLLTHICVARPQWVNSSHPGQNCRHFADDTLRYIFVNEMFCILIKIHWILLLSVQMTITDYWFR